MGGSSKSSSSSNTTNVSGQNAIDGDNLGTAISGVNNSTLNVTATDHGSVSKAFDLGNAALSSNAEVTKGALGFADNALDESLQFADSALDESLGFADNALDESFRFAGGVLDESLDSINTTVASSLDLVSETNRNSMDFAENALDEFSAANSENLQMMAGLAGNQASQNSKALGSLMELAKFNKDGGQSQSYKQQLILLGVVIIVVGFVAAKAVK